MDRQGKTLVFYDNARDMSQRISQLIPHPVKGVAGGNCAGVNEIHARSANLHAVVASVDEARDVCQH